MFQISLKRLKSLMNVPDFLCVFFTLAISDRASYSAPRNSYNFVKIHQKFLVLVKFFKIRYNSLSGAFKTLQKPSKHFERDPNWT